MKKTIGLLLVVFLFSFVSAAITKEIKVKFTSNVPGLHLAVRTGFGISSAVASGTGGWATAQGSSASFSDIGFAPCEFSVAPGTYIFGFDAPKRFGTPTSTVTIPENASEMNATYISKAGKRSTGWLIAGIGAIAGIGMIVGAGSDNSTLGGLGGLVAIGSTLGGVIIALTPDKVSVRIFP